MALLAPNRIYPVIPPLTVSTREACRIWNEQGGLQVRWSDELGEYASVGGDRIPVGTVEERVTQLVRMRSTT